MDVRSADPAAAEPAAADPGALAREVEAERTLRQLTSELATLRDPADVVERVVRAAGRLVDADGAILSRYDAGDGLLHWGVDDGVHALFEPAYVAGLTLEIGAGLTGRAVAERRVLGCGDDLLNAFPRSPESDRFFEVTGFHSLLVAPIASATELFGALEVYARRTHAFDDADAALLEAFAAQAAIALGNARLIADLAASQAALAHRAEVERALREIAARVSAAHDTDEVVGLAIDEATRLLGGDGARVDIHRAEGDVLRGIYTSDAAPPTAEEWPDTPDERADQGISGQAYARGATTWTGDYLADAGFPHASGADTYVRNTGIRSVIASPLVGEAGPFGALSVYSRRPDAFGPEQGALLEAIATQVAVSLANARLIADLDRSRGELARRAEQERALREIGSRLTAVGNPDEVLRRIVAEARRLLAADGSRIDLLDETTMRLRWAIADGATADADARLLREVGLEMGEGVAGRAAAEGHAVRTGDYLRDPGVQPGPASIRFVEETGVRSVLSTPLPGLGRPLGTLSVLAVRPDAFSEEDAGFLDAFAVQASIAITNARRLQALARATEENARRAATEKALREIASRIGALRDPAEIVQLTVDEAARLLGADGARVDVTGEEGVALRRRLGEIVSHEDFRLDFSDEEWERSPGVSGTAARLGRAFGTGDYLADPSFERGPHQEEGIRRLGVHSVLAAPISGESGSIGALTVLSRRRDAFDLDAGATLEVLASLASAALRNVTLENELRASEARLRDLVTTSPDLIWEADAEGRLTFVSGLADKVLGMPAETLIGRHFSEVVDPATLGAATAGWQALLADPTEVRVERFSLLRADGAPVPIENVAVALLEDGRFVGARGAARDIAERERLERELRESDARLRDLMATSPDLIWEADAEGRLTFIGGLAESMLGVPGSELVGRHFAETLFPDPASQAAAWELWRASQREPDRIHTARFSLRHRDGTAVPIENLAVPKVVDGVFAGSRGAARDIRERARLEAELRESEERYRELVQTSPDGVWQADADGRFTFWSDPATKLTGFPPEVVIGRHWSVVVGARAADEAHRAWDAMARGLGPVRVRLDLVRSTGEDLPAEVAAVPIVRDGRFAGAHGSVRDLREQLRLEREVRDSEARFRELVQTSPDGVWQTDRDGHLVFWSDAARSLLGWEPEELMARHWSTIVAPQRVDEVRASLKPLAEGPPDAVARVRSTVVRRDGTEIPAEISGVPLVRDGTFVGIQGTIRDLRPQVRLERELRDQAGALAASAERAHLARELHDSVTQALFSMGLLVRSVEMLVDRDPAAAKSKLVDLAELQRDALAEMRSLIFELRPGSLEREGLANALRTHVAAVEGRLGLPIVLDVEDVGRLPLPAEDAFYRIAQEGLHNIVKHAGARTVHLQLARDRDEVTLRISDDGVGFDPREVGDGHLGLAGMRSRAERVGGRFAVRSIAGRGTEIEVAVPVDGGAPGQERTA